MDLICDASVIIKWFVKHQEQDRQQAIRIRNQLLQGKLRIIVPDLILYEIANVFKMKRGVEKSDLQIIIKTLFEYPLEIIWPSDNLLNSAAQLAHKYDLTIYDAVYFAIAHELGYLLVTADKKLYHKIHSPEIKLLKDLPIF